MSGRDWWESLRNAVPWVAFFVSLVCLVVFTLALALSWKGF